MERLEQIFPKLDKPGNGQKCKGLEGSSARHSRWNTTPTAFYGTNHHVGRQPGFEDHAQVLLETLQEEDDEDKKLTTLAESYINEEAQSAW